MDRCPLPEDRSNTPITQNILKIQLKKVSKVESPTLLHLQKEKINENYILIPGLSHFSWHPKGFLFLIENSQIN